MNLSNYADVLIYSLKACRRGGFFKRGDNILISYDLPALPLVEELYAKLLRAGCNVYPRPYLAESLSKIRFLSSSEAFLKQTPAWEKLFTQNLNGFIGLHAPQNLTNLKDISAQKIALSVLARKPLREIMDKREARGLFSWTLANFPTEGLAKSAGLTLKEYESQIEKACFLKEANPVKTLARVNREIEEISKRLSSLPIEKLRLQSKDCDLEITLGQDRKFIVGGGCNVPSFEIFTSPDWRGARGVYFSDLPSFRDGNLVKGARLEFKAGRVVRAAAGEGEAYLKKMLSLDLGARQIGEFSLTDRRFSKINRFMADTLYDENFGGRYGNSHIALGASYADTYTGKESCLTAAKKEALGFNRSALHWDLVNTQNKLVSAVLKDGKHLTIYEDGVFVI